MGYACPKAVLITGGGEEKERSSGRLFKIVFNLPDS